jgi:hypothetical protein
MLRRRARADEALKDDPRARAFFDVGAEAYDKGQYLLAIDAFKEAYAITERPGLLFSIAQAYQRQFRSGGDEQHLISAVEHYRRYLSRVSTGGRSEEAAKALEALLRIADRLRPPDQAPPPRAQIFGRLLVSSRTPGVELRINGDAVESLPTALELPAGKYHVAAEKSGYEPRVEDISIVAGTAMPLSIELRPLPARLEVLGPAGAEIFVDGRAAGWLPAPPLLLPAGDHWVAVRRAGYRTQNILVRLQRGRTTRAAFELETTLQRDAAWVVGAGAVLGVAATGVLTVLAYERDRDARSLDERRRTSGLDVEQAKRLNGALDARDELRAGAAVSGIASAALIGSAFVLYFADPPAPPAGWEATPRASGRVEWRPLTGSIWGLQATTALW